MSYEAFIGKAYTGVELEDVAYSIPPSPDVTFPGDAVHFLTFVPLDGPEDLAAEGETPVQQGGQGAEGKESYGFNCSFNLCSIAVADANADPRYWDVMRSMGWGALTGYAAGPPKTIYSDFTPWLAPKSCSVIHREEQEGSGAGVQWTYRGARIGNVKMSFPANGKITVEGQAKALSGAVADYTAAIPALNYADSEGDTRRPLVTRGSTFVFDVHEAAGASFAGKFVSAEIDLGVQAVATDASNTADGIGRVILTGDGPITGTIVIEATNVTSFDLRTARKAGKPFHACIQAVPLDGPDEIVYFDWFCRITGYSRTKVNNRWCWSINWAGIYADTGTRLPGAESYNYDAGSTVGPCLRAAYSNAA